MLKQNAGRVWPNRKTLSKKFATEGGGVAKFDLIVIGGSPAMLARAVHAASTGQKVAVFDSHREMGGSWRLEAPFADGARYDCFEHYLAGGPAARQVLTDAGVSLRERPVVYWPGGGLTEREASHLRDLFGFVASPGDTPLLPATEGLLIQKLRRGKISDDEIDALRNYYAAPSRLVRRREMDVGRYFIRNMDDLIGPLVDNAKTSGVELVVDCPVEKIVTRKEHILVASRFGEHAASKVLIGKYFHGTVEAGDGSIDFPRRLDDRSTLVFRPLIPERQAIDYIKFIEGAGIHAMQKVSGSGENVTYGLHVARHIRENHPDPRDHILPRLTEMGVFPEGMNVEEWHWLTLTLHSGVSTISETLHAVSNGRIEVLAFVSLGADIGSNPGVWLSALNRRGKA